MSQNVRSPRLGLPGASVVVAVIVLMLLVIGGAFAVGHTTADSTDRPSATTSQNNTYGQTGNGPTKRWAQAHHGDLTWMRSHMNDVTWMRHHHGQWQWMRAHPHQWSWMRGHGGDMARLRDH